MFKRSGIIIAIIFAVLCTLSAVSAADNSTDLVVDDEQYNAQIVAKDMNIPYSEYKEFSVKVNDAEGDPLDDVENLRVQYKNDDDYAFDSYGGKYFFYLDKNVGTHKATITIEDSLYKAKPVTINLKIVKSNVKLTAKKWVATTKQYTVLKAVVKDKYGDDVDGGTVKFTINGKKYTVKVKDGVAIKKLKLKKAKNYAYKATFSSKNYNTKTVTSKVYVKKAKKYYTLKIRNPKIKKTFKVKLSYKKYVKLLKAKNYNKYGYADVDTGIKRPPEIGGGHYYVGMSTKDEYFTYYGYPLHDYIFLRASSYLHIQKINLYTANF